MKYFFSFSDDILSGTKISDCKVPCTTTFTNVHKGAVSNTVEQGSSVYLKFIDDMDIETVDVDKITFMGSLNFLGSNLGLLPGMGLYQLLEGFFGILVFYKIFDMCKSRKCFK